MTYAADILYALAFAVEVTGIWLLQRERRQARNAIREWRAANPEQHAEGSWGQVKHMNGLMEMLLGNDASRRTTIWLLLAGAVLGTAGNYVSP